MWFKKATSGGHRIFYYHKDVLINVNKHSIRCIFNIKIAFSKKFYFFQEVISTNTLKPQHICGCDVNQIPPIKNFPLLHEDNFQILQNKNPNATLTTNKRAHYFKHHKKLLH